MKKRERKNKLKDNPIILAYKIALLFMFFVMPVTAWQAGRKSVERKWAERKNKNNKLNSNKIE